MNRFLKRAVPVHLFAFFFVASCLFAQSSQPAKLKTSSVQVKMIQSDGIELPAEFKIALYENLLRQIDKRKGSLRIYRDGDSKASNAADLVVLNSTVEGFKAGSERARQVSTFAGATKIAIHCSFTNAEGKALLERDITGKVRFFGGNLRATHDFAKKTAQVVSENFSAAAEK